MTLVNQPLREGMKQMSAMLAGHSTTGAELVDHMSRKNCENILDHQSYCNSSPSKRSVSHIFFWEGGRKIQPKFLAEIFQRRTTTTVLNIELRTKL